jgi:hypothetical protein
MVEMVNTPQSAWTNLVLTTLTAVILCCAGMAFSEQGFPSVMEYLYTRAVQQQLHHIAAAVLGLANSVVTLALHVAHIMIAGSAVHSS